MVELENYSQLDYKFSFHREWLQNLLSKYSSDSRLDNNQKLCKLYPILQNKALIVAPMVDQSELPFRILCRNYGANLCYTPMINARMFVEKNNYRRKFWKYLHGTPSCDRPLIVQLCGSNKESLLKTVRYLQHAHGGTIDGIDLNCGCPQNIAKRGIYGSFLLENEKLLTDVVRFLVENVNVPVSVKVRLLTGGLEDSLELYKNLVDAGVAMLTVHGRTLFQKGLKTGRADWDAIRKVVECLGHRVPIISNGNIKNLDDVRECLNLTGADGVMSSEAILEYPPIFMDTGTLAVNGYRVGPSRLSVAREYLYLCLKYPSNEGGQGSGIKCARAHIHRFLHSDLQKKPKIRDAVTFAQDYNVLWNVCNAVEIFQKLEKHVMSYEALSWYTRHRLKNDEVQQTEVTPDKKNDNNTGLKLEEFDEYFSCLFDDE